MSNFRFLYNEWKPIHDEAVEAENLTLISPKACVIICRSTLEKAVLWLYEHDPDLELPFDTTLASLIHQQSFKNILKPSLFHEINLIRQFGNSAAHGNTVKKEEALVAIKYLFRFLSFLAVYYSKDEPAIPEFDENLLPGGEVKKESTAELDILISQLEIRNKQAEEDRKKREEQAEIIESLKLKLQEQQKEVKRRKIEREKAVDVEKKIPKIVPESLTRKLYIDQSLKEVGWNNLREGYELEYEVTGMPATTNPTGKGYVDYVLWGDDGKPLAVIEAKKTMVDARAGKHQAYLYAECLEEKFGQRPVIFYTNGFETYIWDDTFYPERRIHGFYTKDELQLAVDRRITRKNLREYKINDAITERYYQKEAIKRVAENFCTVDKNNVIKAGSRKALLVMATGTGKTRTAASIVDMLTKCNWAKRVLFLADRNALVSQAKDEFNEHLPHLTAIDLTKEKEDNGTRLVFSTYPTIMNKIDSVKTDDNRFYGVGHFDLIIIDEAHRSIYKDYKEIFEYFDALLIGLTATPRKEIDRNTYGLFEIEDEIPTYAYELDQAVTDKFLVPPKSMSVPVKFIREGIKYHELTDSEKNEYEEKFGNPNSGEITDTISGSALNSWLFNTDTVDKVLDHLMTQGLKVQGGDKLGKTIIFAKNHEHALFIEGRFNKNYPEYAGHFLQVIDNYNSKAESLLKTFKDKNEEKDPQIAVSVDMMDTGVDAPRVVNLVFFKLVKSYVKFWQMIGRGTRLCPDLFGPDEDKEYFLIFDYCQNLEFFKENPEGVSSNIVVSLTQRIFELKLDIIKVTAEKDNATPTEVDLAEHFKDQLYHEVKDLNKERFTVKMNLRYVIHFSNKNSWNNINQGEYIDLKNNISKLVLPPDGDHELSRRFDIIMLNLILALLGSRDGSKFITRVTSISHQLSKVNVPEVNAKKTLLNEIQTEQFWNKINVKKLDEVRIEIRELMKYLETEKQDHIYTSFQDDIDLTSVEEIPLLEWSIKLKPYKERVESIIRDNIEHFAILKLRNNLPINDSDIEELEKMLFTDSTAKEEFKKEYGDKPLGVFIRNIVGLDIKAANEAFSEFLQAGNLRADQMTFIRNIISYLEKNGTIDKGMLFEPPFTDINDQGILGVFDDAAAHKIIYIIDTINRNTGIAKF